MVIFKWLYLSYWWINMNYIGITRKVNIWTCRIPKTDFNYLIASWSYKSFCGGTLHTLHLPFTSYVKALNCHNLDTVARTVFGPGSLSFRSTAPDVLICYSTYLLLLLGEIYDFVKYVTSFVNNSVFWKFVSALPVTIIEQLLPNFYGVQIVGLFGVD